MTDTIRMADLVPVESPAPGNPFRIGDTAYHKYKDLDGRRVVAVHGDGIRIQIGNLATDWLDASLYERADDAR